MQRALRITMLHVGLFSYYTSQLEGRFENEVPTFTQQNETLLISKL